MSISLVSNAFLKIVTSNNWRKFSRDHFWNRKIFLWTNKVTQIENFCCVAPTGHNLTVALVKGHYYCTVYISGRDKPGGPVTQQKISDSCTWWWGPTASESAPDLADVSWTQPPPGSTPTTGTNTQLSSVCLSVQARQVTGWWGGWGRCWRTVWPSGWPS